MSLTSDQMLAVIQANAKAYPPATISIPLPAETSDAHRAAIADMVKEFSATISPDGRTMEFKLDNSGFVDLLAQAFCAVGEDRYSALQALAEIIPSRPIDVMNDLEDDEDEEDELLEILSEIDEL